MKNILKNILSFIIGAASIIGFFYNVFLLSTGTIRLADYKIFLIIGRIMIIPMILLGALIFTFFAYAIGYSIVINTSKVFNKFRNK